MKTVSLAGKVIVVTGGAQGIGASVSLDAARTGAAGVCITGRNAENGNLMVTALEKLGTRACYLRADLTDAMATQGIMHDAILRFAPIDGLVNAAGITDRGHIEDTSHHGMTMRSFIETGVIITACGSAALRHHRDKLAKYRYCQDCEASRPWHRQRSPPQTRDERRPAASGIRWRVVCWTFDNRQFGCSAEDFSLVPMNGCEHVQQCAHFSSQQDR